MQLILTNIYAVMPAGSRRAFLIQPLEKIFFEKCDFALYKPYLFCYNLNCSEQNMARWCSRLARQPVTLEVDGSSPFRVAK